RGARATGRRLHIPLAPRRRDRRPGGARSCRCPLPQAAAGALEVLLAAALYDPAGPAIGLRMLPAGERVVPDHGVLGGAAEDREPRRDLAAGATAAAVRRDLEPAPAGRDPGMAISHELRQEARVP